MPFAVLQYKILMNEDSIVAWCLSCALKTQFVEVFAGPIHLLMTFKLDHFSPAIKCVIDRAIVIAGCCLLNNHCMYNGIF